MYNSSLNNLGTRLAWTYIGAYLAWKIRQSKIKHLPSKNQTNQKFTTVPCVFQQIWSQKKIQIKKH